MKKRVVITGLGIIAPNGIGKEEFWQALISGKSGIDKITSFDASDLPSQIAGEVKDFDPTLYIDPKKARRMSNVAQFAVTTAKMAIEDSDFEITEKNRDEIGVCFGTLFGKGDVFETDYPKYLKKGFKSIHPLTSIKFCPHSLTTYVSVELGVKGITETISSGCTTGLDTIIWGSSQIRNGRTKAIIAGSAESILFPFTFSAASASGNLSTQNDEPKSASKPYDLDREGLVISEGGSAVLLEDLESALDRGASTYAEIMGFGWTAEGQSMIEIDPSGEDISRAIKKALAIAGLDASEIDYINAHGNAMRDYDVAETNAFKTVFGKRAYNIPVSSIKSMIGQALSASGGFQVIASCLILKNKVVPPTINYKTLDTDCDMDYVPNRARRVRVRNILMNAQSFGTHSVLILGQYKSC